MRGCEEGMQGHEGGMRGCHLGGCLTLAPLPHQRLAPATRPAGSSSSEDSRMAWLCNTAAHRVCIGQMESYREVTEDCLGYADPVQGS